MNSMAKFMVCSFTMLLFLLTIMGCAKENAEGIYGFQRTSEGLELKSVSGSHSMITIPSARSSNITMDQDNVIWVPIIAEEKSGKRDNVSLIKDGKIIKTLNSEYNRPIKVIEGENGTNAIVYLDTGDSGKIVIINKSTYHVEQVVELTGYLTDAVMDGQYLYVTAGDPYEQEGDAKSFLYQIDWTTYSVSKLVLHHAVRLNALQEHGEYLYAAPVLLIGKSQTMTELYKINKKTLQIEASLEIPKSPISMLRINERLFILHMSYVDTPMWGGKLSIVNLIDFTVEGLELPTIVDKMSADNGKILFTSSVADGGRIPPQIVELKLDDLSLKSLVGDYFYSNLIRISK
ncbi:hypothetical protein [Paenibacillus sp. YYML68]|uniref:hypothetical protein n=1 Tax=Paenibacillus sp. YYML68 TaxID=2909250 RepID=UPI00248FBAD6|nr:hypothetical protein [Paenibacillus sp. YYML68]